MGMGWLARRSRVAHALASLACLRPARYIDSVCSLGRSPMVTAIQAQLRLSAHRTCHVHKMLVSRSRAPLWLSIGSRRCRGYCSIAVSPCLSLLLVMTVMQHWSCRPNAGLSASMEQWAKLRKTAGVALSCCTWRAASIVVRAGSAWCRCVGML